MTLLVDVMPGLLAKDALKARTRLVKQLYKHFKEERRLDGSLFVKLRLEHNVNFGLDLDDPAHTEIGQVNASQLSLLLVLLFLSFQRSKRWLTENTSWCLPFSASAAPRSRLKEVYHPECVFGHSAYADWALQLTVKANSIDALQNIEDEIVALST